MKEKVLVIGSNSFSGSDFIDLLLEKACFSVIGVSRSPQKKKAFLPKSLFSSPDYAFHQIDLNRDLAKLSKLLDDFQPDYIVNFAAQSEVAPSWDNPTHWYQTNVVAVTALADLLKGRKNIKRYVHISSPEVYGSCKGNITEDAVINPSTPYAASKAGGDLSLMTYYKNFDLPLVLVRATNVYGPRQQLFKIIPRTMIYLKMGRTIELHGGGSAIKSYIHIRDVSYGEFAIMNNGKVGEVYHLSPDGGYAVHDIVKRICVILNADFDASTKIVQERLGQDAAYVIDSSKAGREFGWKPEISLDRGLEDVGKWIHEYWDDIHRQPLEYIHKS